MAKLELTIDGQPAIRAIDGVAAATKEAGKETLAMARALADNLKVAGDLSGAMGKLEDALAKVEQVTVASVRGETALLRLRQDSEKATKAQADSVDEFWKKAVKSGETYAGMMAKNEAASLAGAQSLAKLQIATNNLAGAELILNNALIGVNQTSSASIAVETQLAGVRAALAKEISRAAAESEKATKAQATAASSAAAALRQEEADKLRNIRAQAAMLTSAGQYSQAIQVLTGHLATLTQGSTAYYNIQSKINALIPKTIPPPLPPPPPPQPGMFDISTGSVVRGAAALLGIQASVTGLRELVVGTVQADIAMQRMENTFSAVSGSVAAARNEMGFLREESNRIGIVFVDTAQAFSKFQAATIGTRTTVAQTREIFIAFSEAGQRLHLGKQEMSSIFLALEQMASKGVISMEELRRQLGQYLPGAFNLAATAMGMTTEEFNKAVKAGTVMSDELLPKLAAEVRKVFPLGEASKQTAAELNRVQNAWFDFKASVGENARPVTNSLLKVLSSELRNAQTLLDSFLTGWKLLDALRRGSRTDLVAASNHATPELTATTMAEYVARALQSTMNPLGAVFDPWNPLEDYLGAGSETLRRNAGQEASIERYRAMQAMEGSPQARPLNDAQLKALEKLDELDARDALNGLSNYDRALLKADEELRRDIKEREEHFNRLAGTTSGERALQLRGVSSIEDATAPARAAYTSQVNKLMGDEDERRYQEGMKQWAEQEKAATKVSEQVRKSIEEQERAAKSAHDLFRSVDSQAGMTAQEEAVSRITEKFGKLREELVKVSQESDSYTDVATALDKLKQVDQIEGRELGQVSARFQRYNVGEATLIELLNRRKAVQIELLALEQKGADPEAIQNLQRQLTAINNAMDLKVRTGQAGPTESFQFGMANVVDQWGNASQRMMRIGETTASSLESSMTSAFTSMVLGQKSVEAGFHEMANSIIADIARIVIQQSVSMPIANAVISTIGSFYGGGASAGTTASVSHSGGMVGASSESRTVPASLFRAAPRFHGGGTVGDEVPIIARRGEKVTTPEQEAERSARERQSASPRFTIINVNDPAEAERYFAANPGALVNIVSRNRRDFRLALGQ